jgi:hypothetical protein
VVAVAVLEAGENIILRSLMLMITIVGLELSLGLNKHVSVARLFAKRCGNMSHREAFREEKLNIAPFQGFSRQKLPGYGSITRLFETGSCPNIKYK